MAQRQIKCNYCDNGQDILYDPNASPKTTNLDGTKHYHTKYSAQPSQETVTITESAPQTKPMVTRDEEFKIKQAVKEEAIAKAHEENMEEGKLNREESEKLRMSINNLEAKVDDVGTQLYNITKNFSAFNDIVRAYLDSHQQQNE